MNATKKNKFIINEVLNNIERIIFKGYDNRKKFKDSKKSLQKTADMKANIKKDVRKSLSGKETYLCTYNISLSDSHVFEF